MLLFQPLRAPPIAKVRYGLLNVIFIIYFSHVMCFFIYSYVLFRIEGQRSYVSHALRCTMILCLLFPQDQRVSTFSLHRVVSNTNLNLVIQGALMKQQAKHSPPRITLSSPLTTSDGRRQIWIHERSFHCIDPLYS
jgi:hypothetical protein